jgi:DNA-binding Lrp family transcriptional regulator
MKKVPAIQLNAEVARLLSQDPSQSNRGLADRLGVSEGHVRRIRATLELAGLLAVTTSRVGRDGVQQTHFV